MIHRIFAIVAGALALTACAGPKIIPFDAAAVDGLRNRALVPVTQSPPVFIPTRASRASFAMIGAMAMMAEAQTYAAENGIVDPSADIENDIQTRLQEKYGARAGERLDLTGAAAGTPYPVAADRLYVDAKVYNWGYVYFPTNWSRFRVNYGVTIHLVDGAAGKVVGQYNCMKTSHPDAATAPTLEQLLANRSALMNATLKELAAECATEFEAAVLNTRTN